MLSRVPIALYLAGGLILAGGAVGAYLAIDSRGYSRCEFDTAFRVSQAQEEAHQFNLAEIARGDGISAKLAKTQQKLRKTEHEYLTYANAITGNCNSDDFRMFVQYASGAKTELPDAPSAPPSPTAPETPVDTAREQAIARAIGGNIAINYARLDACVAGYESLIQWHEGALK